LNIFLLILTEHTNATNGQTDKHSVMA